LPPYLYLGIFNLDTNNVGWHEQTRLSMQCVAICRKHGQTKFVHATTHVNEKVVGFLSFKTQPNLNDITLTGEVWFFPGFLPVCVLSHSTGRPKGRYYI